jgi:tripartite ATP-independent transporter DctP family solute receptor
MLIRTVLTGIALALALALASVAQAQTILRMAHTLPASDTHHLAAQRFAESVKQRTNGQVVIEIHAGGALGNDPSILQNLRLGTLDLGFTGNPFFTSFAGKLNVLDLPYLFTGFEHVYRVLDGPVGGQLLAELEQHQLKGIAFWEIGFRNITNSKRPILRPEDLRGIKIRTTPNPAHVAAFQALGASPAPLAFPEVYLALQNGTVDGQENPINLIAASKFYEVQKHLSLTQHAYTASVVAMNLAKFKALTPPQQTAILEAAREAAAYQRQLNRDVEGENLANMKQAGLQVVEKVDPKPFQDALGDKVKKTYVDKFGSELVELIEQARP